MSKKTLLSESQVAKWMKLANIKGDVAQNFLNESKDSNKKVLNEMGMGYTPARDDDMPAESGMEEEGGMGCDSGKS